MYIFERVVIPNANFYPPTLREDLLLRRREIFDKPPRPEVDLDDFVQRRMLYDLMAIHYLRDRLGASDDVHPVGGRAYAPRRQRLGRHRMLEGRLDAPAAALA